MSENDASFTEEYLIRIPVYKWRIRTGAPRGGSFLFESEMPNAWRRFWYKVLLGWIVEPYGG